MNIKDIFKHDLQVLVADRNEGKSHFLYSVISQLNDLYGQNISKVVYGLDDEISLNMGCKVLYTPRELERVTNSIIIIDEMNSLFDLDNRNNNRMVEEFFRRLAHKNNKVLLCGLPRDFKKFVCSSAKGYLFKRVSFDDMINGSMLKKIAKEYAGVERGNFDLDIDKDKVLHYDGSKWLKYQVHYNKEFDTKKANKNLFEVDKNGG